jgi:hypothetical protein
MKKKEITQTRIKHTRRPNRDLQGQRANPQVADFHVRPSAVTWMTVYTFKCVTVK